MTTIGVLAAAGRARLTLTQGPISPRILRVDANGARIGLVATTALLLGGDHIVLDITVGPGARLELVETAGTVAYDADGVEASWTVTITVADGGLLIWAGEPFVVSRGANVQRSTSVELGAGAVACLRETLVLGRSGEVGGGVRSRLSVRSPPTPDAPDAPATPDASATPAASATPPTPDAPDAPATPDASATPGGLLLLEDLDLTDHAVRRLPGVLGDARVIDTVSLLGMRAPALPALPGGRRFDLDGPGTLARSLTSTFAASRMGAIITDWVAAADAQLVRAATAP